MYPNNPHNRTGLSSPVQNRRLPMLLAFGFLALLLVVVVLNYTLNHVNLPQYYLSATNLKADGNFGYMQGDEVYAYNGLAFYSTNVKTGKQTFLYDGTKLPAVKLVRWAGNHGAFLTFKSNFSGTQIEAIIQSKGAQVDATTQNIVWYLDFSARTVSIVSQQQITDNGVVYDDANQTLYYTLRIVNSDIDKTSLFAYNINTKKVAVIANDLGLRGIGSLTKCSKAAVVCIIGQKDDKDPIDRLYAVNSSGKATELLNSNGRIITTGHLDYYVTVAQGSNAKNTTEEGSVIDTDDPVEPAFLYNLSTGKKYSMGFKVGHSDPTIQFTSDSSFFALDPTLTGQKSGDTNYSQYRGGQLKGSKYSTGAFLLEFSQQSLFKSSLININNGPTVGDTAVVTGSDGLQYLFGPRQINVLTTPASAKTTQAAIDVCNKATDTTSQYFETTNQFRILVKYDNNFNKTIRSFGDCMVQRNPAAIHGHNYAFMGYIPETGNFATD